MKKIVLGKDVVLALPKDPSKLLPDIGYPTHQQAWLPMWFVLQYHTRSENPEETEYRKKMAEHVHPEERERMKIAMLKKAQEFMEDFRACTAEPKKKYKKLTRVVQDILLYSDVPAEVIEDHDTLLEQSPYRALVELANDLRSGQHLEQADVLVREIERVIAEKIAQEGGQEHVDATSAELKGSLRQNGKIFVVKEPTMDQEKYIDLCCYDLVMGDDAHDLDVVSITDRVSEPEFYQIQLFDGRRMDTITVPPNLKVWDTVRKQAKESYQPVSFIVMTHTKPVSGDGQKMQERLQTEISPREVAEHYLGAAKEFLDGEGFGKSWRLRKDDERVPQIKKCIPLHRVVRDLLPRAIYMLKTNKFPAGVPEEELFTIGETFDLAQKVETIFQKQDASVEELAEIAEGAERLLTRYYLPEHTETYEHGMDRMRTERESKERTERSERKNPFLK